MGFFMSQGPVPKIRIMGGKGEARLALSQQNSICLKGTTCDSTLQTPTWCAGVQGLVAIWLKQDQACVFLVARMYQGDRDASPLTTLPAGSGKAQKAKYYSRWAGGAFQVGLGYTLTLYKIILGHISYQNLQFLHIPSLFWKASEHQMLKNWGDSWLGVQKGV